MEITLSSYDKSTNECRELSVDRLIDHTMSNEPPPAKGAYSKRIKELNELYDTNKERYRYGKKVFGRTCSKIQRKIKVNTNLFQETEYIKSTLLTSIADKLWH